jgi:hypothetical protein
MDEPGPSLVPWQSKTDLKILGCFVWKKDGLYKYNVQKMMLYMIKMFRKTME